MTVTPSSQSVEVTHTATFYAVVRGVSSDTFTYQWRRGGKKINRATRPVLVIKSVKKRDISSYKCFIRNKYGDVVYSRPVHLTVTSELNQCNYNHHPKDILCNKNYPHIIIQHGSNFIFGIM